MRLWLVMLGTLPLLAVGSGTATGTAGPQNGLLAAHGQNGIFLIDSRAAATRLVPKTKNATGPAAWSPDGSRLAFETWDDAGTNVYSVRADGTDLRLVLKDASSPSWSPDGKQLVVVRENCYREACSGDEYYGGNLFLVDAGGSNPRQLTSFADGVAYPAWSPDGKWIAFIGDNGVDLVQPKSGKSRWLLRSDEAAHDLAWSPDGTWIAFAGSDGIYRVRVPDGKPERLARDEFPEHLAWSPDGSTIAFDHSLQSPPRMAVAVLQVDAGKQVDLTESRVSGFAPTWSPDGKQLAFLANTSSAPVGGCGGHSGGDVWAMGADGNYARLLAKGEFGPVSWGADVPGLTAATPGD